MGSYAGVVTAVRPFCPAALRLPGLLFVGRVRRSRHPAMHCGTNHITSTTTNSSATSSISSAYTPSRVKKALCSSRQ